MDPAMAMMAASHAGMQPPTKKPRTTTLQEITHLMAFENNNNHGGAAATVTSTSALGAASAPCTPCQCKALQQENASLRAQLAVALKHIKNVGFGSPSVVSSVQQLQQEQLLAVAQVQPLLIPRVPLIKYTVEQHAHFLRSIKAARKAPAVDKLDLSELVRTSPIYPALPKGGRMWLMIGDPGPPTWRTDKKLDAVLTALKEGPDEVLQLDLGDARWAAEPQYGKDMLAMLRKYKKHVTSLRITTRALVQWATTSRARQTANAINVLGGMPKLTKLQLVATPVDNNYSCYAGEFRLESETRDGKKTRAFAKLASVELYLTEAWYANQFGNVDRDCREQYGERYGGICGGGRDEDEDDRVGDLLEHRANIITHLDMSPFRPTRIRLPILDRLAGLPALRSVSLRPEMAHLTMGMPALEEVHLHAGPDTAVTHTLQALHTVAQLPRLRHLQLPKTLQGLGADPAVVRLTQRGVSVQWL